MARELREEREREAREREERRQRAQELVRLKQEETARLDQLDKEVTGWHKAELIREYVEAVKRVRQSQTPEQDERLAKWVEWALQQADRVDPLRESPPSVLDQPDAKEYNW